jgi:oligopeptide/dipeptide ABC transporter ATP-binding protein
MLSLLRLIPEPPGRIVRGQALFQGKDLLKLDRAAIQKMRGSQVGFVFQDPMTSLNPLMRIGAQLSEPMLKHLRLTPRQARNRSLELLKLVGIPGAAHRLDDYPHQFSGGMRQRVMIAMALACEPKILIADEPTTALDVTIQAQIVALVKDLRRRLGMAVIWITHDLGVLAGLAHRVVVMYSGSIVEQAPVRQLYKDPRHPYTLGLLGALPRVDGQHAERLANIAGRPPDLLKPIIHCPFSPRCRFAIARCWESNPDLLPVTDAHQSACWVMGGTGDPVGETQSD